MCIRDRYWSDTQHRQLTLEKKMIPLVPLEIEPVTFPSRVRRCSTELSPRAPSSSGSFFRRSVVWVTAVRLISSFTHRMHLVHRVDWAIFMREVLSGRVMFCDKFDGREGLVILKLQENIWSGSVTHFDFQNSLARWPTMTSLFMIVSRLQTGRARETEGRMPRKTEL